jgi:glutathione synthase/RimK-type ligase-like ATP-grasp enzyme
MLSGLTPIDRVSVAELKLYQLRMARQLGSQLPRTLVSRDALELQNFCRKNEAGTICKPIFHGMYVDEKSSYSVYTRRVTADSIDEGSVRSCPVLLQEEIPRSADVRATFIGSQCFVAEIKGEGSLVDWRDPDLSVCYSKSMLSDTAQAMCRAMLEKLELKYGAFDFVRRPDGELVFLEVNPTGEWAWLEERLGFPMRDAFILSFAERA